MWITVRRRAARQHDFEQPNRFIYFAEFKKIGVGTAFFMKSAEFLQKVIENWLLFRGNPKIRRLPKTVITQDIEQMLLFIHNMLTTCANC